MLQPKPSICISNSFNINQNVELIDSRAEMPFLTGDNLQFLMQEIEFLEQDDCVFEYAKPNIISILISNSHYNYHQSNSKAKKIFEINLKCQEKNMAKAKENTVLVYDYLSFKTTSIINAFQSIEAFSNVSIPDDYVHIVKKNKCTENYTKKQIERHFTLTEKMSIICSIYSIENIKNTSVWRDYTALEKLRNDLIHQKSSDRKILMKELFSTYNIDHSNTAIEVISYIVYDAIKSLRTQNKPIDSDIVSRWPQLKDYKFYLAKEGPITPWNDNIVEDYKLYK